MKSVKASLKLLSFMLLLVTLTVLFFRISDAQRFLHKDQPTTVALAVTTFSPPFITPVEVQFTQTEPGTNQVYVPTIMNGNGKFIGIIMPVYWSIENVATYMLEADNLAGKKHTAVGWFIDVQDPSLHEPWQTDYDLKKNNIYRQLEQLWLKGYVSFVKIGSSTTIREIADGQYDDRLDQMAQLYKRWLQNGEGRKAMFAPFQEMNGEWVPYYPLNAQPAQKQKDFKDAYRHIQDVFLRNEINRSQIWWGFAPNGASLPEENFEYYYPGDDFVDLLGFASYNFGFCDATVKPNGDDFGRWENFDKIYEPYIRRLQTMAPGKPIIITETGTSALTSKEAREQKQYDYEMKAEWFKINYTYLANQPMVLGVFYFDFNDLGNNVLCDLGIPRSGFYGYQNGVANPQYNYLSSNILDQFIP